MRVRSPLSSRCRVSRLNYEEGTTLIEALVATALLVTVSAGAGGLLTWSARAVSASSSHSIAVWLAAQKLEQLSALEWSVGSDGVEDSDEATDVGSDPMGDGGQGLRPSPGETLDENIAGYVDFVGADGTWRGTTSPPQPGAAFVRRWSVVPLASDPRHSVVLTVAVRPLSEARRAASMVSSGAMLQTARTRLLR